MLGRLSSHFRPSSLLSRQYSASRGPFPAPPNRILPTHKPPPGPHPQMEWIDPRPPWFYRAVSIATWLVIPSFALYAVFFGDFGEEEHVFMPVRRWATTQKAKIFELSPAELAMLQREVKPRGPTETRLKAYPREESPKPESG